MVNKSYSFKLFSHKNPDKLLVDHLSSVANLCKAIISEKVFNFENAEIKNILSDVAYITGLCHDFGKATNFFQEYLKEENEEKKLSLKSNPHTNHGLLSALFTYYIVSIYLNNKSLTGKFVEYLPIISFFIVKRHHGNLHNALYEIQDCEEKQDIINEQLNNINYEELQIILDSNLSQNVRYKINIQDISENILQNSKQDILRKDKRNIRNLKNDNNLFPYFISLVIYSALINSDKTEVVLDKNKDIERFNIDSHIVDKYISKFSQPNIAINEIRNSIYYEVTSRTNTISLSDKIFSLNAPTGTGKTLTALSFALKLRERLQKEKGFSPRIIYSLPFLSIIDQNHAVFEDLFKEILGMVPPTNILLKHHHLSDPFYFTREDEYELDECQLLIEGWNAEIIVTTFWQFFHTLFSNRNRMLLKFHTLINSIIILDEVQSIPHKYWKLVKDALIYLAEKFNTYVVLATATQPLIFSTDNNEIIELVSSKEKYFSQLNRIKIIPKLEKSISLPEFNSIIEESLKNALNQDFLIVLNTIDSSIKTYQYIDKLNLKKTSLYYLSTNIIPKERLKRINEIRDKKCTTTRKIIVSTQLIEAGVDIDTDIVYRDFSPLDSINQVAGRCNRNYSKDKQGAVYVIPLKDDRTEFYKYIYDPFLVEKTKDVLSAFQNKDEIREEILLNLNNEYYKKVKQGMSTDSSIEALKYLYKLSFKDLGHEFNLIKESYAKIDIFIEIDEEAKNAWKDFIKIRTIKDPYERKRQFLKIKKNFYDYVISVAKTKVLEEEFEDTGIVYINHSQVESVYDKAIGFKHKSNSIAIL